MTDTATELPRYDLAIGGEFVPSRSGRTFLSTNPATGRPWAEIAEAGGEDVRAAVGAAGRAFESPSWRGLAPSRRGRLLMRLGDLVAEHADELAEIEARENGKLLKEMRAQLRAVPDWLYYYGGLADKIEGRTIPLDRPGLFNYTLREPVGVVGVITPWNSPSLLTTMASAPALAAGNTIVVKPSEVTSAAILELVKLAAEAGLPPGVLNVVAGGRETGEALVSDPAVRKISFTGGAATGRLIARIAGERLVPVTLELGGKSPNVVFADADLDAAEAGVLAGIYGAAGQTCIAGSRAFVEEPVYEELLERLARRAGRIVLGDPLAAETQMGPVATEAQLEKIAGFVDEARSDGVRVVAGGRRAVVPELPNGYFYEPTVLADVDNASRVAQEEIFGPVLAVMPFRGEDAAVELANATRYGLAAGVWTRDVKRAHRVAQRVEAGTVWVNMYRALTVNSPFGGYKESGIGALNGLRAVDEFLRTKSVCMELGEEIHDPFTIRI